MAMFLPDLDTKVRRVGALENYYFFWKFFAKNALFQAFGYKKHFKTLYLLQKQEHKGDF